MRFHKLYDNQVNNFYRMQDFEGKSLQMQLVDTSCILNTVINQNCSFDGSNITYISGAYIVSHNVFQNSKNFVQRATDLPISAIAYHKSGETSVALATLFPKTPSRCGKISVQFYFYNKKPIIIETNQELDVIDMVFLEKKKVLLLAKDLNHGNAVICLVSTNKKIRTIELPEQGFKLIWSERKVMILNKSGLQQFLVDSECLEKGKKHINYSIKQYILAENDQELILDTSDQLHYLTENDEILSVNLRKYTDTDVEVQSIIKVGRGLLVSYKNLLLLSYFRLEQATIEFVSNYQYGDKIKANIICMQSSIDEMNLILAVQVQHKDLVKTEHFLFNLSVLSNDKKFINPFVRLIPNGCEMGEICSFQKLIPSEIYYLIGPSIVNYTYVQSIAKKHKFIIHESPKFIAVHPLGHLILCAFETQIKFYLKVELELVEAWTQPYICTSAKFTQSGLLFLCIFEDNLYQMSSYDANCFKLVKIYSNLHLKHAVQCIDLDETENELILYSNKDLSVHRVKNGERISEFKEKKQKKERGQVSYVCYDSTKKSVLFASDVNLTVCNKVQHYCLNFSHQKEIRIGSQISCIYIKEVMQTIFLGTKDGQILYSDYPLNIYEEIQDEKKILKCNFKTLKVHTNPITDILITNNCKYLFASVKGDGISIARFKKNANLNSKNHYNPFDISNFNFIQTSSKPYLENVQDKLKNLLQKRKTIFNQLDEFKKEWEYKRANQNKIITTENKKMELISINQFLNEINRAKQTKQLLTEEIDAITKKSIKIFQEKESDHHQQLLQLYKENDTLKEHQKLIASKCNHEFQEIMGKCDNNIKQIETDLSIKFELFNSNYRKMRQNLQHFEKRQMIEKGQAEEVRKEESLALTIKLRQQERQLYKETNQIKGEIAKNRKQIERFLNRRDFLENKKRFFVQEIKFCQSEKNQLLEVKEALEIELSDLETLTHKKEKRLRKYFIENEILIKYQFIHDHLLKSSSREVQFLDKERSKLSHNINQLQKQIVKIAQEKAQRETVIEQHNKVLRVLKEKLNEVKMKYDFVKIVSGQVVDKIEAVNKNKSINDQQKTKDFIGIYKTYYEQKHLENYISKYEESKEHQVSKSGKNQQEKITEILIDHKDYLTKNMQIFEKYNSKIANDINISSLKYKTENYNLISECNVRKQQISKKKRILHQLVDSIRETTNFMTQLQNEKKNSPKNPLNHHNRSISNKKINQKQIPFVAYQKNIEEQLKENQLIKHDLSDNALWRMKKSSIQVRKMLEIQKIKGPEEEGISRRIKTAMMKKGSQSRYEVIDSSVEIISPSNYYITQPKPQTANQKYRRNRDNIEARKLFSRNKSSSKPTTCTTYSKGKSSLFL